MSTSPASTSPASTSPASAVRLVSGLLPKINLGVLVLALIFFLLPWTTVQCNGRDVAKQSGLQTITAGVSLDGDLKDMADHEGGPGKDDDLGYGFLALIVLLSVLAAVALAAAGSFLKPPVPVTGGEVAVFALVVLIFMTIVGFPIDRSVNRAMEKQKAEMAPKHTGPRTPEDMQMEQMTRAMVASVGVKSSRASGFYLELLALMASSAIAVGAWAVWVMYPEVDANLTPPPSGPPMNPPSTPMPVNPPTVMPMPVSPPPAEPPPAAGQ